MSSSSASDAQNPPPEVDPPQINHQCDWERFDDEEAAPVPTSIPDRPPLPPPRSELEKLYGSAQPKLSVEQPSPFPVEIETDNPSPLQTSLNPFEAPVTNRPKSPFEDFSSSIAEALINNSQQKLVDDPTSASALATAGKELFEIVQEQSDKGSIELGSLDSQVSSSNTPCSVPESEQSSISQSCAPASPPSSAPLNNPFSTGLVTTNVSTAQFRTSLNPSTQNPQLHSNGMSRQLNSSSILRPIPQEGTFSPDSIANNINPFYSGSVNAGHYPALIPLSKKPTGPRSPSYVQNFPLPSSGKTTTSHPTQKRPGRPPPKPQPYSGECQWNQQANHENSNSTTSGCDVVQRRQASMTFTTQRLPSIGEFSPFGDLLSNDGGMAGYVLENANASPLV